MSAYLLPRKAGSRAEEGNVFRCPFSLPTQWAGGVLSRRRDGWARRDMALAIQAAW